ncbi:ABC protein, subfamily ABCH [Daphnia pulex]|uniref:ABC protein, subfamily ABCH n=1 Tax=Daphnia pulex TaxID=6669 RepID=E9HA63_DAPPU|nr:ABC protein, subfamily ABCH [Daphnia pulex]|eukprot:EFX71377.1 ABC protein, subfamily ABCH [Daphnia pulex]
MAESSPTIDESVVHPIESGGETAVYVRNACKSFGVGKRRATVLRNLDMNVKKGTIYGLLGASGCGKTTLLSCIVGRRSLDCGDVLVLGGEPGSPDSGIPGPRVGYMPQELALYGDFTIKETLEYFGRIYNLSPEFVKSQMEFIFKLLDLPPGHRYVKTLSGGQQRRVSFAVALFHEPELLILDEPTVGVDPMLRKSIWNHLVRLSTDHGRTVIITTHYIEEARQAGTIGLMRSGHLLAEESPQNLLASHGLRTLEEVFLKLSRTERAKKHGALTASGRPVRPADPSQPEDRGHDNPAFISNEDGIIGLTFSPSRENLEETTRNRHAVRRFNDSNVNSPTEDSGAAPFDSGEVITALIRKNFLITLRNIGMFAFVFLMPGLQSTLFCLAIGRDPTGLKMAVVNEELDPSVGRVCNYTTDCTYSMFSCRYLRFLDNTTIVQIPYQSLSDALDATLQGTVWGVIHFGHNFTEELLERQIDGNAVDKETIQASRIGITLDWSNEQIALTLQHRLVGGFNDFNRNLVTACDYQPVIPSIPVEFMDPVYGKKNPSFTDFMAPGIILTIAYTQAVSLTAAVFINERKQGLLDRSLVAGVRTSEILLAHLVTQFTVLVFQSSVVLMVMLLVFKITCQGSLALAMFITLLQGLCGMFYGFVVSSLCDQQTSALQLSLGSFFPNMLLSGVLWPMEGMSIYLRYLSYFIPLTHAIEALRCIFARGWGIDKPEVYYGIVVNFGWIVGLLLVCLTVIRVRKYTG